MFALARGDANGAYTQGNIASGATDAGNPVKVGGRYNAALPTLSSGQRADLQIGVYGRLLTAAGSAGGLGDGTSGALGVVSAADQFATGSGGFLMTGGMLYNGSTWDRQRKPNGRSRITSTAATGSPTLAKSTAGDLGTFFGQNGAAITYVQLYDKTSAPIIGTDIPVLTFPVPANAPFNAPAGLASTYFANGIGYAFTTDAAGNTASAAGAVTAFALTYA